MGRKRQAPQTMVEKHYQNRMAATRRASRGVSALWLVLFLPSSTSVAVAQNGQFQYLSAAHNPIPSLAPRKHADS
jgi:hypothetical protein